MTKTLRPFLIARRDKAVRERKRERERETERERERDRERDRERQRETERETERDRERQRERDRERERCYNQLTHFMLLVSFDTAWKHHEPFSGDIKRDQWHEMG